MGYLDQKRSGIIFPIFALLPALVALQLVAGFISQAAGQQRHSAWIGTWASSPERDQSGTRFTNQTLRQIVHTSIGGSSVRLHISNIFGSEPLTIQDVHIAFRQTGSTILASSDQAVHFTGASTVTIPPGAEGVSDPLPFAVPALADIAVSMYLPGTSGSATYHASAHRTSYIAPGDVSGQAALPNPAESRSYYFLTNIDVSDPGQQSLEAGNRLVRGTVVALGASITEGYRSTFDTNRSWPSDLGERLVNAGFDIGVVNQGISGNRLLAAGAGPDAGQRFERDALGESGVRWVIFSDDPINDLGSTKPPPTAADIIAGIRSLIALAHRHNVKFFCSTLTPYEGASYWTAAGEAVREQVNDFIRGANNGCDAVIDQDAATHDPAHPTRYLPAYDGGDHLHPNDAGQQAIADAIELSLFSQP